nr:IS21 family transposase [Pseudanabaena sp. PCC 7367]
MKQYQVQVYKKAREVGCNQNESAEIAGISVRSGSRIEQGKHQPKSKGERDWRTRRDPLSGVWEEELEPMLRREPRLEAMTLYEYLAEHYPGQYEQQLRTLQRRVQVWKSIHGKPQEVMFEIRHQPGEMGLSDFTELKQVEVTIKGKQYEHLLYHYRLAYSGWQYVQVIEGGESFIGLSEGLQNALHACGGVPKQHRTDNLSAAYRNMAGKRHKPLTQFYAELCEHYGMSPSRNNPGVAHENGSIESPHGHFKRRLRQALYLRGSFEFESVSAYQEFIEQVVAKLNCKCSAKFAEEKVTLQPLPRYRCADYEELTVRVTCHSTISVRCILYTVPSRLIGRQLNIHIYHNRLVGYLGQQQVVELPRLRVHGSAKIRRARCINYRHVIDSLRRKPRAFIYCTWQQDLLPNQQWRQLWQRLQADFEIDNAARIMVEALYIAAKHDRETTVADYLETQLQQGTLSLKALQQQFLLPQQQLSVPQLNVQQHSLSAYDQLLETKPEQYSEPDTQTATTLAHAPTLADYRAEGHPTALGLRPVLARSVRIGTGLSPTESDQTSSR